MLLLSNLLSTPVEQQAKTVVRSGADGFSRRSVLLALLAPLALVPLPAPALDGPAVGTYSLKGIPGVSALTGADKPRPVSDLGVLGRGTDRDKTGRLNNCDRRGCISSFSFPEDDSYVPPLTYASDYSLAPTSSFEVRKRALLATERGEAAGAPEASAAPVGKSRDEAFGELRATVEAAGGKVISAVPSSRYVYAEFVDEFTGATDDVEFLLSLDRPIVGFRSAPRGSAANDKRQRERIRDIRKALQPAGWKSVGRIVE